MALAALNAGLAFSNTSTALAHSISYEMTLRHGLPHGIACSFTAAAWCCSARSASSAERDAVLARAFGVPLAEAPAILHDFLEGLGVSTRFDDYGVTEAESARMVAHALDGVRGKNFIGVAERRQRPRERQHECQGPAPRGDADRRRIASTATGCIDVFNPYTEQLIGTGAEGDGRGREARLRHRQGLQVDS